MIRIAVLQHPQLTSDRDVFSALERAGMQAHSFLWHEDKEKLADFQGVVIAKRYLAESDKTINRSHPILQCLKELSLLGKPILGISQGAELLIETGLVPGLEEHQVGMALAENHQIHQGQVVHTGYYDAWVHVRLSKGYQWNVFTRHVQPNSVLRVPFAHAKGRFTMSSVLLAEIKRNGLPIFQYCDEQGRIADEFPMNATGSLHSIAAIANKTGNVMAILPHIECTPTGDAIFKSMHDYIKAGYVAKQATLHYQPR